MKELAQPAPVDGNTGEETVEAEDIEAASAPVVDVLSLANAKAAQAVSAAAACATSGSVVATIGGQSGSVSPDFEIPSGKTSYARCDSVNTGYEGNITLSCTAGQLSAESIAHCSRVFVSVVWSSA